MVWEGKQIARSSPSTTSQLQHFQESTLNCLPRGAKLNMLQKATAGIFGRPNGTQSNEMIDSRPITDRLGYPIQATSSTHDLLSILVWKGRFSNSDVVALARSRVVGLHS